MWQKNVRYLDYNAGSGLTNFVQKNLIDVLSQEDFFLANPSSRHRLGQRIQQQIYLSSLKIARSLGSSVIPDRLLFTSSGTEANQTVIRSAMSRLTQTQGGVILGAGEHSATHDLIPEIELKSKWLRVLPLLPSGHYDLEQLKIYLDDAARVGIRSIFLSLFWANNETGVITRLDELKKIILESPIPVQLHLDGAQVWGKISIDVEATPAEWITFSAHKIGAPAGTGVVWSRNEHTLEPLIIGTQNHGLRGGTENALGILACGFAAESIDVADFIAKTSVLQSGLESELKNSGISVKIWGQDESRVSNTTRFSFLNFSTYENWVELLDLAGFAVSHGSACKSKTIEPSRVLVEMGATKSEALNAIRVSFGPTNTLEDVRGLVEAIRKICARKTTVNLSGDFSGATPEATP